LASGYPGGPGGSGWGIIAVARDEASSYKKPHR